MTNLTEKRKELSKHILARCDNGSNTIFEKVCEHCDDAKERNGGKDEGKCAQCTYPPFMCSNDARNGLLSTWKGKLLFQEVIGTPKYALLHYAYERMAATGEITLKNWVTKAEELGLGENVAYWKAKLLEEELALLKEKYNALIDYLYKVK